MNCAKALQNECHTQKAGNIEDPVKKSIAKYQYHPRITNIQDIMKSVLSLFQ